MQRLTRALGLVAVVQLAAAQRDCYATCTTADDWECGIVPCIDNDLWGSVNSCGRHGGDFHPLYEDDLVRMNLRDQRMMSRCNLYTRMYGNTNPPVKFAEQRCISDPEHPANCVAEGAHTDGSFRVSNISQQAGCRNAQIDYVYVVNHTFMAPQNRGTVWGYCDSEARPSSEICVPCTRTGSPSTAPTRVPTLSPGSEAYFHVRSNEGDANCTVHGHCVSNREHGSQESCQIQAVQAMSLNVTFFEVETASQGCGNACNCDCLRVGGAAGGCQAQPNGANFCGEDGPAASDGGMLEVEAGTMLHWSSDGGLNRGGFTICAAGDVRSFSPSTTPTTGPPTSAGPTTAGPTTRRPTTSPTRHACTDGSHSCDTTEYGICERVDSTAGFQCSCAPSHSCSDLTCTTPGHTCVRITAGPTPTPTPGPTAAPTAGPTTIPTAPTPAPTVMPTTAEPTSAPTAGTDGSAGSASTQDGDGSSSTVMIVAVVVVMLLLITGIVLGAVWFVNKKKPADDRAGSFENPMYASAPGSATAPHDSSHSPGYMDISPDYIPAPPQSSGTYASAAPGPATTGYMDVAPQAGGFDDDEEDV